MSFCYLIWIRIHLYSGQTKAFPIWINQLLPSQGRKFIAKRKRVYLDGYKTLEKDTLNNESLALQKALMDTVWIEMSINMAIYLNPQHTAYTTLTIRLSFGGN